MAAQDAQLLLKVGLDLSTFRNQLATLGQAAAGYNLPIKLQFGRQALQAEVKYLREWLGKKKFNIELNIVGGLTKDQFEKIQARLDTLSKTKAVEIPVSIKNGATGQDVTDVLSAIKNRIKANQEVRQGGGKLRIETSIKPSLANSDAAVFKKEAKDKLSKIGALEIATKLQVPAVEGMLKGLQKNFNRQKPLLVKTSIKSSILSADVKSFKREVESKLSGITVKINAELETIGGGKTKAQIEKEVLTGLEHIKQIGAERMGGGVTEPARREQLRTSLEGEGITRVQGIAKQLGVKGYGSYRSANVNELIDKIAAEASIEAITKYLDPKAMMRNPDRNALGKVLDTFARGLFNMFGIDPASIRAQQAERRRIPAINWPAVAGSAQRPPIGPSSTGKLLAGAAPLRAIEASRLPAGLLPSVTKQSELTTGLEALMRALSAQSQGPGTRGAAGSIVAMESGFMVSMRDRFAKAAERYLFGVETQVVDFFDAAVRQVESAIDRYMTGIQSQISQRARQGISVVDLGATVQRLLPEAPAKKSPLMLPPAGGTTATGRVRVTAGGFTGKGYVPEGGFPSDTMLGGRQGPATFIGAGSSMEKFKTALDIAAASSRNFRASQIPLVGGLKEITEEFGFAVKQVLLFGTAYKGLAFVTSLPGQILNAAKSQQQYNNALQTATQDTGTFAKELLYVDNVQRAFGLNLETTRTGFTRLYASMAPADFDSGSIEKLFTGISAATAALQLTPDKAERVIYAFGQMASKGQIMSEELKGQLGDVLPGALAIFAKAAGMSVKEFSKAMEDGVFVGGKFREVFAKVSDELMTRFGTGAQAAGKSLQGLLNTVGGDFQRTLESFAPLANSAAQAILTPLGSALRQLSTSAQIAMGEMERVKGQLGTARQDASSLRAGGASASQIKDAERNVASLEARYRALNEALKDPAVAKQVRNIQLFIQELAKAGNVIMNVTRMIGSILNPLLAFLGTNLSTVVTLLVSFTAGFAAARLAITVAMGALTLFNVAVKALGAGAVGVNALSAAFKVLGVSAGAAQIGVVGLGTAMKVLLFSSGLGIAVGLLAAIAGAALSMGSAMRQAAQEARQAMQDMAQAAIVGNTALIQMRAATYKANLATLQSMKGEITRGGGRKIGKGGRTATVYDITPVQRQILGAVPGVDLPSGPITTKQFNKAINDAEYMQQVGLKAATRFQQISKANETKLGLNKPTPGPMAPDAAEATKPTRGAARAAERAAQQARELKATLQQLREQLNIEEKSLELQEAISFARADGNEKLVAFLQTQEKFYDIDEKSSKLQRDFTAGKIKQAELDLRQRLLTIERKRVEITEEERLNAILRERVGITNEVMDVARRARVNAFEMGLGGASKFRTDINLDLTQKETTMNVMRQQLDELINKENQVKLGAQAIGSAFGTAFKDIVSGSTSAQEALANMMQSIADHFLDMAAKIIAQQVTMMIYGIILKALGITGGASGVFGPGGAPNYSGSFGGGSLGGGFGNAMQMPLLAANGAVWQGGFQAFANGGMVTGPTLGLVGEGKYNEAIVPLPDGRSIPVQLQDGSIRDKMGSDMAGTAGSPMLSMSFQSTTINGVEYVDRAQLEAAMAETRRISVREGATRGATIALDKLANSPSSRRRVGLR